MYSALCLFFVKYTKCIIIFVKKACNFGKSMIVEGTPVPIPNTEVKLNGAEDTLLVTTRKNRKMPT